MISLLTLIASSNFALGAQTLEKKTIRFADQKTKTFFVNRVDQWSISSDCVNEKAQTLKVCEAASALKAVSSTPRSGAVTEAGKTACTSQKGKVITAFDPGGEVGVCIFTDGSAIETNSLWAHLLRRK